MGSSVDARHADSLTLQPGGGSIALMNSTVVYQCTDMDATSYLYLPARSSLSLFRCRVSLFSFFVLSDQIVAFVLSFVVVVGVGGRRFVMNMFDTTVNVGQNSLSASEVIFKEKATLIGLGSNNALGDNMYFQQLKTGEIVKIWYNTGDSPYFVNVKVTTNTNSLSHLFGVRS